MRLGDGEEFGKVLVELRSAEESHPPIKKLPTGSGCAVPDDTSQPVRIKACTLWKCQTTAKHNRIESPVVLIR